MNGYEVIRKIREVNNKVPIIANTAFAMIGDEEKAKRLDAMPTYPNLSTDFVIGYN